MITLNQIPQILLKPIVGGKTIEPKNILDYVNSLMGGYLCMVIKAMSISA